MADTKDESKEVSKTREQFTFYRSFYDAICKLKKASDRLAVYESLAAYALYGDEPKLTDVPAAIFDLIKPTLDASKRKAESGGRGGRAEANGKQTASKAEANGKQTAREKEKEKEGEKEIENECYIPPISPAEKYSALFESFWAAYPNHTCGKSNAYKSFQKAKPPADVVDAVERQKASEQWRKDNGKYIPMATTWLNQRRWDAELKPASGYDDTTEGWSL